MQLKSCNTDKTYDVFEMVYENSITGIVCGKARTQEHNNLFTKILNYGSLDEMIKKEMIEIFKEEANTLKKVGGCTRNVPKLYDSWDDRNNRRYVMIMSLAPGISLRQWMEQHRKEKLQAKDIFLRNCLIVQMCECMRDISSKYPAIVHRDLKPENIYIDFDQKTKRWKLTIIDFGCANLNHVRHVGTTAYQAPEQIGLRNTRTLISSKTDIFSIGQMAYEFLIGRSPVINEDYVYKARENEWVEAPKLDDYLLEINGVEKLEQILKRMTSLSPEDRPAYGEIIRNLKTLRIG